MSSRGFFLPIMVVFKPITRREVDRTLGRSLPRVGLQPDRTTCFSWGSMWSDTDISGDTLWSFSDQSQLFRSCWFLGCFNAIGPDFMSGPDPVRFAVRQRHFGKCGLVGFLSCNFSHSWASPFRSFSPSGVSL